MLKDVFGEVYDSSGTAVVQGGSRLGWSEREAIGSRASPVFECTRG